MEPRVALQLLPEELLLPFPPEWALLPWTIEEPASSPLRVGWHEFLAGQLWLLQLNYFQAPILPAASGAAGLRGFVPSHLPFTRSWTLNFLRTDWLSHYPYHSCSSL